MTKIEKKQQITEIIKTLNTKQYATFLTLLKNEPFTKKDFDFFDQIFATRHTNFKTATVDKKPIFRIYSKEIKKLFLLMEDEALIRQIGGIKVLFHGETGTGKTTVVNYISKNKKIKFEELRASEVIDYKMGQTQFNLFEISNKLNSNKSKTILFIDELDSIIMNRQNQNDIGEHSRIVSSFIKFLDDLNENIFVFAATNVLKNIDSAIVRRFPIKIEGKKFNFEDFISFYSSEKDLLMSTFEKNLLKKGLENQLFTISDLNNLKNYITIERKISNYSRDFLLINSFFEDKINRKNMNAKKSMVDEIKGVINGEF